MGEIGAVTAAFTEALKRSRQSAIDLGDPMIGVGHIALGVIRAKEGSGFAALSRIHPEMHELESVVIDASRTSGELAGGTAEEQAQAPDGNVALSSGAEKAVKSAQVEVERLGHSELDTGHLLLGILRERHSEVSDALARYGATYEAVERELTAG
ncbi:MAG TPA: Clp protease N-terminal domain-containing protein [Candidatus Kapabacteria bacterium]|nr:Clp protease N-terminal domain-containing protein [Candidatus Kapabacteria bacterium]